MVVTGDTEGKVKFFDSELKMVNWYEDTMKFGPLCSISFSYSPSISMIKAKQAAGKRSVCTCVVIGNFQCIGLCDFSSFFSQV